MAQTKAGAEKQRANKLRLSLDELRGKEGTGLAWCNKCKTWKPTVDFHRDSTRYGGIARKCKSCSYERITDKLSPAEARAGRDNGIARCVDCKQWFPVNEVTHGRCKEHIRAYHRRRYAEDARYRAERREHAHSRKRCVTPIHVDNQGYLMQEFSGKCAYCNSPATTFDHIVPVTKRGSSQPINVVACCQPCNSSKNASDVFDWLEKRGIDPKEGLLERLVAAVYVP